MGPRENCAFSVQEVDAGDAENLDSCRSNLRIIDHLIKRYRLEHGRYPEDIMELVDNGYLRRELVCPFDGSSYLVNGASRARCPGSGSHP